MHAGHVTCAWLLLCVGWCTCKTWTNTTVESPLLVGAFNIQNLGSSKMNNQTIMDVVKKILIRYDLILIQEIVTTEEVLIENLVKDINKLYAAKGSEYKLQISERLGRGTAKEQYAYLYRSDRVRFLSGHSYPDKKDDFMRPPYIAHFATPTLRDLDSMVLIGIHTQPKNAANETSALAQVYDYAVKTFKTRDAIVLGDMNAGCANVRVSDWDAIELWRRKEFTWLITHDLDTTISTNCCPYDRMVIAGDSMSDAIIWNSVNVFRFRDLYGLSTEMTLAVSDHWPIEVKLKGGTSEAARTHLQPSLCVTLHDTRTRNLPAQLKNQRTTYGFSIANTESATELYTEAAEADEVLGNLRRLQAKYPQLVSKESLDALTYKVLQGALRDASSNDDPQEPSYSVTVVFSVVEETTTVHCCVVTTLN